MKRDGDTGASGARERLHRVRRIEIATCYIIKSDILIIILV